MFSFLIGFVFGCVVTGTVGSIAAYFILKARLVRTARRLAGESVTVLAGEARKWASDTLARPTTAPTPTDW